MSFPLRPAQFLYNFARVLGRTDILFVVTVR